MECLGLGLSQFKSSTETELRQKSQISVPS